MTPGLCPGPAQSRQCDESLPQLKVHGDVHVYDGDIHSGPPRVGPTVLSPACVNPWLSLGYQGSDERNITITIE